MHSKSRWFEWSYSEWNQELFNYVFSKRTGTSPVPVERIAATPEELVLVGRDFQAHPDDITRTYVSCMRSCLPHGSVSFERFCRQLTSSWSEEEVPPFFAMLWLTCLVSYGYPTDSSGFHERIALVFGRQEPMSCLPALWELTQHWTSSTESYRTLILPPRDDRYRTNIGFSWFLTFPHHHDRRKLRQLLHQNDLIGEEPPIHDVVKALVVDKEVFSRYFRTDLGNFVDDFIHQRASVRDSPFWRAVRQEALAGDTQNENIYSQIALMATYDEDESLFLYLACNDEADVPDDFEKNPLDEIDGYSYYLTRQGSTEGIVEGLIAGNCSPKIPAATRSFNRGVLVFQQVGLGEYSLSGGSAAAGANLALVHTDRLSAFIGAFQGIPNPSRFSDWYEVRNCSVKIDEKLPVGLEDVRHLQETMPPIGIRFVGGIRTTEGFHAFPGFLPTVRFVGADEIKVTGINSKREFNAESINTEKSEWQLPDDLAREEPDTWIIEAYWQAPQGQQSTRALLNLVKRQLHFDYKRLGIGRYFYETANPGEALLIDTDEIPLAHELDSEQPEADLLEYQYDIKYLGTGLGDISWRRMPDHDWMLRSKNGHPSLLLYLGDLQNPRTVSNLKSNQPKNRRNWSKALNAPLIGIRSARGEIEPIDRYPVVQDYLTQLRKQSLPSTSRQLLEGNFIVEPDPPSWFGISPSSRVDSFADALAALAVRTSGISHKKVIELASYLIDDHTSNDFGLLFDVLRGWSECGAFDVTHTQGSPQNKVLVRRPRLVCYRIGMSIKAVVMGLVPSVLKAQILQLASSHAIAVDNIRPPCRWMPELLVLECDDIKLLRTFSHELSLGSLQWLRWPSVANWEPELQDLRRDTPPGSYLTTATWDFQEGRFKRTDISKHDAAGSFVTIEKRVHRERCPIYVLLLDAEPIEWSFIRNWVILLGYSIRGEQCPFTYTDSTPIRSRIKGVYLPLSFGRYCAALGDGLAGPSIDDNGDTFEASYIYPIGYKYRDILLKKLPDSICIKSTDSGAS